MTNDMNLPNNSRVKNGSETEEVRVRKVIQGHDQKKSLGSRFKSLIASEGVDVKQYLLEDVLLPTIKNTALTMIDMLLPWGGSSSSYISNKNRANRRRSMVDRVSYDREYDRRYSEDRWYRSSQPNWEEDITFDTYADAMDALHELEYILDRYKHIRITDLYDVRGKSIGRYGATLKYYGWVDIRGVKPIRIGDGWGLSFPKAIELEG